MLMTTLMPVLSVSTAVAQPHAGWRSDFDEAEQAAKAEKRPLLIHFQAWYCGPCKQMDSQVFSYEDVRSALQQDLIAVQIDVTRESDVAARFNASTVPRDVVVYPNGTVETVNVGFMPRHSYIGMLREIGVRGENIRRSLEQQVGGRSGATDTSKDGSGLTTPTPTDNSSGSETREPEFSIPADSLLGLEGYCPVRLGKSREWVLGRSDLREEYRGVVYRFASEADQAEFVKNPERFAPQNLGCDPVVLLGTQRAVTGKIQYGAFFDKQLYLFSSLENKSEFRKNPLKFTRIRHAIRVENIEGTRFQ